MCLGRRLLSVTISLFPPLPERGWGGGGAFGPQVLLIWVAVPGRPRRTRCLRARKCARPSPVGGHRERDFLFRRRPSLAGSSSSFSSSLVSSPSPGSSQSRGTALAPPVLSASNRGSQRPSPGPASRPAPPGWPASSASHLPAALDRKRTALHSTWARSGGGPWPPCTGTRIVALGLRTPRAPQRWLLPGRCCYAVAPVASCCCYSASCCPSPAPST